MTFWMKVKIQNQVNYQSETVIERVKELVVCYLLQFYWARDITIYHFATPITTRKCLRYVERCLYVHATELW